MSLFWLWLLGISDDKHCGFYQIFDHQYNSAKSGTHVPVNEKRRLSGGTLWSLPLSSGSKEGYLSFWHPRYLEDELGCTGEDEVLDNFSWGLGIKEVKDKHPWAFIKMESQCLGKELRVPGSSNIPTLFLQTEDKFSKEVFLQEF